MTRKWHWALLGAMVLGMSLSASAQAAEPATQPSGQPHVPKFALSEMRVQETAAIPFLCISTQTNSAKLQATIDSVLPKLTRLAKNSVVEITGPCVFVYHGLNSNAPFALDAGFPVAEGTNAAGEFSLKQFEKAMCATADFHGPARALPEAHQKFLSAIAASGQQAGTELREIYLHFSAAGDCDVRLQVPLASQESMLAAHKSTGSPQPSEK